MRKICTWCEGEERPESDLCPFCKGTKFDIDGSDQPVCPYCGHENSDDEYAIQQHGEEEVEFPCGHCGKEFLVRANILVTFTSRKTDEVPPDA